jgi:hypothetical protein
MVLLVKILGKHYLNNNLNKLISGGMLNERFMGSYNCISFRFNQ